MSKTPKVSSQQGRKQSEAIDLCVYGHFYQPLREDPFSGEVPHEPGAAPYANYNEKIAAECYRPNAILGNFRRISFDIGPTLTCWLAANDRETLQRIVEADAWNVRESGHGNALAQPYHHTILPLATRREKELQVDWGIADFVHRFGRNPEGMWLPETAVDTDSLEVLAERGIRYTVLAPWQAQGRAREPRDPSLIRLPSGRKIAAFFFESNISGAVSFNPRATTSAQRFIKSHLPEFGQSLILIASDGELYGHHQRGRERFLHNLLFREAPKKGYHVCSLAEYFDAGHRFPAGRIREKTSWSCHHGIARWSQGCPCTEGDSSWKPILRQALDQLALGIDQVSMEATNGLLNDFWAATRDYIGVILGTTSHEQLLDRHASKVLSTVQSRRVLDLLQSQYFRQAMFTSCAFFWDDLGRLEVNNAIGYAARAVGLVGGADGAKLEERFAGCVARATSERTGESGSDIFARWGRKKLNANFAGDLRPGRS